jgi:TolB-like protein
MSSLIQDFEYDVFISYRHKDNKYDGWVTEFVANLRKELEATFKEDVSVYFDENPHDGLLETHQVNDSLKSKLKCLVFIPIISQTYCDPKSFAWQNEFIAFRDSATSDQFGLKVKLANGNVASRILPVRIHEIDSSDKAILEQELGGVMRCVDFIYKSAGVNRPLRPREEESNDAHTVYRNQINKVANAIKDLITGIQSGHVVPAGVRNSAWKTGDLKPRARKNLAYISSAMLLILIAAYFSFDFFASKETDEFSTQKSIAVLPFQNMSGNKEEDYFAAGITEDIFNQLTRLADVHLKSRGSTLRYKDTSKPMKEIGDEMGVSTILSGSVRRVGNKVRIVVRLTDAGREIDLWSETYDREIKDVLRLQREIAMTIADVLHARLTRSAREEFSRTVSNNVTAYDYLLRARQLYFESNFDKPVATATAELLNKAISLDPNYAAAYALKGRLWWRMRLLGAKNWVDSAAYFSNKAIALDSSDFLPLLTIGHITAYAYRDFDEALRCIGLAYERAPNDPRVLYNYGMGRLIKEDAAGADLVVKSILSESNKKDPEHFVRLGGLYFTAEQYENSIIASEQGIALNPMNVGLYRGLSDSYLMAGKLDQALSAAQKANTVVANDPGIIDRLGWLSYLTGDLNAAEMYWSKYPELEKSFHDTTQYLPFRHRLGMVKLQKGEKDEAMKLFQEQLKLDEELTSGRRGMGVWGNLDANLYDLAAMYAALGKKSEALEILDKRLHFQSFLWLWGLEFDPFLNSLRDDPRFKTILNRARKHMEFRKQAMTGALEKYNIIDQLKLVQAK